MSTTKPNDAERRQLIHDGELEAGEATAEVPAVDRGELAALKQLGDVLRADAERAADEAEPAMDAIWARLERQMSPDRPERSRAAAESKDGFMDRLRGWFSVPALTTGLAGAALGAVLVFALRPAKVVHDIKTVVEAAPPPPAVVTAMHVPAEVESLEVTGGTGTVFQVEGDDGDESTVIWVTNDEPAGSEGPI